MGIASIVSALIAVSLLVAFAWASLGPAVAFAGGLLLSFWASKMLFS